MVMNKKLAALFLVGTLGLSQGVFAMKSDSEAATAAEQSKAKRKKSSKESTAPADQGAGVEEGELSADETAGAATPKSDKKESKPSLFSKLKKDPRAYLLNKYTGIAAVAVATYLVATSEAFYKALAALGVWSEDDDADRCGDCGCDEDEA